MNWTQLIIYVIQAAILVNVMLLSAAYMVLAERKIAAWIQNRVGPNRVGWWGLLQSFADVFKLYLKEDIVPAAAHYKFHALAPMIAIAIAITVYAVIPWSGPFVEIDGQRYGLTMAPNMNIAVLVVLAMTSVAVYSIVLAGWSSNSKYSLLGGLRASAQMISYELAMGLSVVTVVLVAGSLNFVSIIQTQTAGAWNIFYQPVTFVIFLICALAETNRAPFDLPEAEPELVGGYHTEYSGMKFGLLYLAEYAHILASSAIIAALFFGGWDLIPFVDDAALFGLEPYSVPMALIGFGAFAGKAALFVFVFMWIRWTLPRFRYDQLMNLGWKVLLPLALANLAVTGFVVLLLE
ncbi:MAG: NADH-quinone oxidoreductase subunit NuoH [Chlorobi bacterium]|nr:MAG: NADH-quinone oxidoreductase subunit NuoH [Bacteroidota bacterium]KXK33849.1 MAG: NADH dehydrogenase subunit H [Chlorobi bacterium OLB6]MBE2266025.1 NADH-quinone oxidoreductase subunit NuoH [Flavobacteriales bacterium]MBL1161850.1 NADH-quinone oxidoreductase subunit NuoH [Chlorobiota bacterium]MBW7854337.1 NADH-quinone oxidoreductase subunit NuoH [Candidatus Kapabacteria bacterium]MCC6330668.1 NADH-quinone oxidoreductase subunit NuoH [Ignavibacteria bacterium]